MLEEYDLSTIKRRTEKENDDQYESFNITKALDKIREHVQDKKNTKRFGY